MKHFPWWRHQMETFSTSLAICAGNSPASGEFPAQRPVTRSFGVFFDLCLNKRLSKQSWGWWFQTLSRPLWRHRNALHDVFKGAAQFMCTVYALLRVAVICYRSPVNSPHNGQWRGALMFTLICARINGWVNNHEVGNSRRHRAHYDVIVMTSISSFLLI